MMQAGRSVRVFGAADTLETVTASDVVGVDDVHALPAPAQIELFNIFNRLKDGSGMLVISRLSVRTKMASPFAPVEPSVSDTGEPSLVKLVTKLDVGWTGFSLLITLVPNTEPEASTKVVRMFPLIFPCPGPDAPVPPSWSRLVQL